MFISYLIAYLRKKERNYINDKYYWNSNNENRYWKIPTNITNIYLGVKNAINLTKINKKITTYKIFVRNTNIKYQQKFLTAFITICIFYFLEILKQLLSQKLEYDCTSFTTIFLFSSCTYSLITMTWFCNSIILAIWIYY